MFKKLILYFSCLTLLSQFSFSQVPVASFNSSPPPFCSTRNITFFDQSSNSPTSWSWTFPGATPSISTLQYPTVVFPAGGIYSITLIPANASFTGVPLTQTMVVSSTPTTTITPSLVLLCPWETATITASAGAMPAFYIWMPFSLFGSTIITPQVSTPTSFTVFATPASGCTDSLSTGVIIPLQSPISNAYTYLSVCELSPGVTITNTNSANTYSWSTGNTTSIITVSPPVSQTYTCFTRTGFSCTNYHYSVSVVPIPTITVSSATICPGTTTSLLVSGATNYTWTPTTGVSNPFIAAPILNPGVSTNYTITGQTTGACISSTVVNVMVAPAPTLSGSSATMCAGESLTLCVSGASTYVWYNVPGLNSYTSSCPVASPSVSSAYSVIGRSQFLCMDTLEIKLDVNVCTGLFPQDADTEVGFKLYPNPNNGKFFIQKNSNQLPTLLRVYTIDGKLLEEREVEVTEEFYSFNLKPGIYFVKFVQNNNVPGGLQKIVVVAD